ncbi:uncharacterized protein [Prorops nasuta]|uniref:uncharacterized protein n=1 Tax=Prorops nasuta TaxID=863751 RepID=UPI0034CD34DB
MFRSIINIAACQNVRRTSLKLYSKAGSVSSAAPKINVNIAGLSDNCVKVPDAPVGPGASKTKEYKNPEYFCYHVDSFGEAEVELAKHRLPAPSNKRPFQR